MAKQFYKVIPPSPANPLGSWYTTDRANANYFGEEPPSQAEILERSGGWDVEGQSTLGETFDVSTGLDSDVYGLPDAPSEDTLPEGWVQDTDQYGQKLYVVDSYTNQWGPNPAFGKAAGGTVTGADDDGASTDAFKQWTISQQQATQAAAEAGLESAQQILAGLVADFGLDPRLAETLNAELVRGESPTALAMRIRTTDEYKARFPGMAQRRELGLPAISETDYLDIERQYRSVMQAAKLPSTFHDEPADFDQWITGDVSPQEFQERVTLAETARDSADAETRRLLSDFYDISDGDLTAYYLDPTRAETIFEDRRRLESAGLAAASRQTVGQALEMETAEALQAESVQRREIQQRLGQRAGLTGELLGSEAMTASEIAEGEFGLDVEAIATLRRRREGRVAGFRGTAGALTTGAGITGFGAAE